MTSPIYYIATMQPTISSLLTPLALKTAGVVLILSSMVDLLFVLLYPPEGLAQATDKSQFWIYATTQLVDRGLLPLVGIAFVVAGDWIKIVSTENGGGRTNNWRIAIFSFASLLGLIFILTIPFQLFKGNEIQETARKNIDTQAKAMLGQVEQLSSQSKDKDKIKQQLSAIEAQIKSGKAKGEELVQLQTQKANLELLSSNPKEISDRANQQIQEQKNKAEEVTRSTFYKTGVRTSISSLLLAVAYTAIGWTGLRRIVR
jgi:hypothetical protein